MYKIHKSLKAHERGSIVVSAHASHAEGLRLEPDSMPWLNVRSLFTQQQMGTQWEHWAEKGGEERNWPPYLTFRWLSISVLSDRHSPTCENFWDYLHLYFTFKGAVKWSFLLLQNGQLCSWIMPSLVFFWFANIFLQKMGVLFLSEVEKLHPWNNSNIYPCDVRRVIAIWNYWPRILYVQVSTLEGPKFMISLALTQIYVRNKGLNEELLLVVLPVLRHKSFAQNFCPGHTLNGCCAELASNLDAEAGPFTSSDPII